MWNIDLQDPHQSNYKSIILYSLSELMNILTLNIFFPSKKFFHQSRDFLKELEIFNHLSLDCSHEKHPNSISKVFGNFRYCLVIVFENYFLLRKRMRKTFGSFFFFFLKNRKNTKNNKLRS